MAGVGIRAPVRSVIGMAVETAPGQSGVAGLLLDEREQVDWSRSVARRPCAIAEGKSASRPRDKNRMLTMRVHNTCCSRKLTEQKKLTQLDWLAKIFVKLTSFGTRCCRTTSKCPRDFWHQKRSLLFSRCPNSVRRRREGPKGRVGRRVQKRQRGKGFRVFRK